MVDLPEQVSKLVQRLHNTNKVVEFCVAYSGGMDSHVLLQSISVVSLHFPLIKLRAVHINHGLSSDANIWAKHCADICRKLAIEINIISVKVHLKSGESPEALAREARYGAFRSILRAHECLLTAQHQDDQAETLLLQLLRGSGPQGLASMPEFAPFAGGYIARPLLTLTREQIFEYAQEQNLSWVEDASNKELSYSRNYLRHEVIPLIKKRWPAFSKTVSRSAQLCAEAQHIIEIDSHAGMQDVLLDKQTLSVSALNAIDEIKRKNIVRYWIKELRLPGPTQAGMQQIINSVINASRTATPLVAWPGCEIRRYQDRLYAMPPLKKHTADLEISWDFNSSIQSPIFGKLSVKSLKGNGVKNIVAQSENVKIVFRQGGETYCEYEKVGTRPLKKLFQELAIPPWLRGRIPLIYFDNHLVAIADFVVCSKYKANSQELGFEIIWEPAWSY